ncbi:MULTISPECIES: LCP family protein [Mesobacillus]|uniref:Regulatory protein MsrR n=2 Tax=Mesobacillus TaxID=2675231 RepID=A0A0D6Z7A9_9BACI|nr:MULTISPECIES: LCP family protein [Mesobacillus]KIY21205.1 transcriptional regulator [Mesobacillus subterraneus]MDQ0415125.1 LCP family protein required for cell wall assembly [Mesobacillus stamsii]
MRSDKYQRSKKRKRIRWSSIFLLLILLVGAMFIYAYMQYRSGVNQSEKGTEPKKQEYQFNGERDRNGLTNILLIGSDARGDEPSRSDTIMIASYNPDKESYKLTSIMRDTYVEIPGHGMNKINAALAFGGPELLRQTIKDNFDISLQYYSIVNFEGFVRLIDEAFPDGVKVDVEKKMSKGIGVTLEPGVQRLDGKHLLGYVRFRQDAVGDFGRVERQQSVLKEVGKEFASIQTLPKLPKLIGVVSPFVNTNMNTGDILYMGKGLISKENRDIETMRIPVEGLFENQRVSGAGAVLAIDLEANRQALQEFLAK